MYCNTMLQIEAVTASKEENATRRTGQLSFVFLDLDAANAKRELFVLET